ncbi:MAG TPA: ABC transporter permease [Sporichthya sp.]|nr:ABC transporter permease [Sporichthya sp.]
MWLITLRDLQYRARRFAFGVIGTALVFAVTLLLAGLTAALNGEADRNIQAVGADAFVVRAGASGPFSSLSAMPDTVVEQVAKSPGVTQADPFVMAFGTTGGKREVDVTIIGYRPGGLGPPVPVAGRQPSRPNEVMVDKSTGYHLGDKFSINGLDLTVVGQVEHMTLRGGVGDVYLNIKDAQSAMFKGNRIVTSIVTKGVPTNAAALDLKAVSPQAARSDMLRLFSKALDAIDLLNLLLWAVAIAVVGTTIYLSVLERVQDFAVMKAIGVSSQTLVASLAIQAMVVSLAAAGIAVLASYAIAPLFPMPVYLSAGDSATLIGIAALVGMLASLAALRRAVGVDPAKAFGA